MPYYHGQLTGPCTPRIPLVSLPAESPRPASAISGRFPSSHAWPASTFASHRQIPTAPAPDFARNYQDPRTPLTRRFSTSSRNTTTTYDPSTQYESSGQFPTAPSGNYTANQAPAAGRPRSMAPAPLVSILKSSRTRSLSMSSNPEVPRESLGAVPARSEPRSSNLSKSHTVTAHRIAPLKEEVISLSWPLVQYNVRRRSRNTLLYFDARFDPRDPRNLLDNRSGEMAPISEADRNLPASTHCTLTEMIIRCPQIGKITVTRSKGIRCIDVFSAIYDAYHKRLRSNEMPQDIERYTRHFEKRCEDSSRPAAERMAGMRRVDLLSRHRIFDGLSREGTDWKLDFVW